VKGKKGERSGGHEISRVKDNADRKTGGCLVNMRGLEANFCYGETWVVAYLSMSAKRFEPMPGTHSDRRDGTRSEAEQVRVGLEQIRPWCST
jgi:hypothetical protein